MVMIQYVKSRFFVAHIRELHNCLEVGIVIHFLHITSQYVITEDIVSLKRDRITIEIKKWD